MMSEAVWTHEYVVHRNNLHFEVGMVCFIKLFTSVESKVELFPMY